MSIHLSARLRAIAELVPLGASLIDVGTDHGMLPVWLAQEERIVHAWGADLRSGPLQSARRLIAETKTDHCIQLRLTDGLQSFGPEDGDTVVIAGMGGETMMSILRAAPWTREHTCLILEPQSKQSLLRRWLFENGYRIFHEALVKDGGRIYPILMAEGGEPEVCSQLELYTGKLELVGSEPLLGEYLDQLIARARVAAPYDQAAQERLRDFEHAKERLDL